MAIGCGGSDAEKLETDVQGTDTVSTEGTELITVEGTSTGEPTEGVIE